jgi:hypothetical protein
MLIDLSQTIEDGMITCKGLPVPIVQVLLFGFIARLGRTGRRSAAELQRLESRLSCSAIWGILRHDR